AHRRLPRPALPVVPDWEAAPRRRAGGVGRPGTDRPLAPVLPRPDDPVRGARLPDPHGRHEGGHRHPGADVRGRPPGRGGVGLDLPVRPRHPRAEQPGGPPAARAHARDSPSAAARRHPPRLLRGRARHRRRRPTGGGRRLGRARPGRRPRPAGGRRRPGRGPRRGRLGPAPGRGRRAALRHRRRRGLLRRPTARGAACGDARGRRGHAGL
ncbi:MAG: hypothetical protein AVDCRST_MAG49-228, partial [uncultured Thermomicrobiales bacterium]